MSSGGTHDDTTADLVSVRDPAALPQPGLALVLSGGEPQLRCLALGAGPLRVGRGLEADLRVDDATASRLHAEISIVGGAWMVDGSRHGTFVDGVRVDGVGTFPSARTLRIWRERPRLRHRRHELRRAQGHGRRGHRRRTDDGGGARHSRARGP